MFGNCLNSMQLSIRLISVVLSKNYLKGLAMIDLSKIPDDVLKRAIEIKEAEADGEKPAGEVSP